MTVTIPDDPVGGVLYPTTSIQKLSTSIKEIQTWGTMPWTTLTLSANWSAAASGVQTPRYRRFAGEIQFDGVAAYTGGAISTTHVQLSPAVSAVAAALPANMGSWCRMPCYQSISLSTNMYLEAITDGRLFVIASASVTNPVVSFFGLSFADLSVG